MWLHIKLHPRVLLTLTRLVLGLEMLLPIVMLSTGMLWVDRAVAACLATLVILEGITGNHGGNVIYLFH
jgi:hypothetical protein